MSGFLAASDACMATLKNIPMFKTTYPNKVFDYMAAGRPTILAIDGVIREVMPRLKGKVGSLLVGEDCPAFNLGPWVGAQVAPQQSLILRPGHFAL
jgi:hypothetical protein